MARDDFRKIPKTIGGTPADKYYALVEGEAAAREATERLLLRPKPPSHLKND